MKGKGHLNAVGLAFLRPSWYNKNSSNGSEICPAEMVMRDTRDYENIFTAINRKKTTPPQTDLSGQ